MSAKNRGKRRAAGTDAWQRARQLCRLSALQVEMAKKLGMNPDKLPALRPSPSQRWKVPVAEFIEELYRKRFGPDREEERAARVDARRPAEAAPARRPEVQARYELQDLRVYLVNLFEELDTLLERDPLPPDLPARVGSELHTVAERLIHGEPIPPWSDIRQRGVADSDRAETADSHCVLNGDDLADDVPF